MADAYPEVYAKLAGSSSYCIVTHTTLNAVPLSLEPHLGPGRLALL